MLSNSPTLWRTLCELEPIQEPGQKEFSFTVPALGGEGSQHIFTRHIIELPREIRKTIHNRRYLYCQSNLDEDPEETVFKDFVTADSYGYGDNLL